MIIKPNKIEKGNGECVKAATAEGHQWVFNVARNSRTRMRPSAGPLKICILVQLTMIIKPNYD